MKQGIGFIFIALGAMSADSEWLWFPALCAVMGTWLIMRGKGENAD